MHVQILTYRYKQQQRADACDSHSIGRCQQPHTTQYVDGIERCLPGAAGGPILQVQTGGNQYSHLETHGRDMNLHLPADHLSCKRSSAVTFAGATPLRLAMTGLHAGLIND